MARYDDTFVDRFLEPWDRHDVDGALALMTDDCIWEVTRGREPHGTVYTGRAPVRSAIVEAFKALPDAVGRGLRAALTGYLSRAAIAGGEIPFLDVFPSIPAVGLCQIGIRERLTLWAVWHQLSIW